MTRLDVIASYWIFFGRHPESEAIIAECVGQPFADFTRRLLESDEYISIAQALEARVSTLPWKRRCDANLLSSIRRSRYAQWIGVADGAVDDPLGLLGAALSTSAVERAYPKDRSPALDVIRARLAVLEKSKSAVHRWRETLGAPATHDDVIAAYVQILGRRPETDGAVSAKIGLPIIGLLQSLLNSDEFQNDIASPIIAGELVDGHRFHEGRDEMFLLWVKRVKLLGETQGLDVDTPARLFAAIIDGPVLAFLESSGLLRSPLGRLRAALANVDEGLASHQRINGKSVQVYDRHHLNLLTNRIYDLPEIVVDPRAPRRINMLVPAFDFKSMSAGFFGVFQVARFISKCGFRVRLVMFDNFYWNEVEFRQKLLGYPGIESLFDELEFEYIGDRSKPLVISPNDSSVATVWYSAYLANKISILTNNRPFLYLIQDHETHFFAAGSLFSFAHDTYDMNYNALFSTKALQDYFIEKRIGIFGSKDPPKYTYFNNSCSRHIPTSESISSNGRSPRLAFYSRPVVHRNMFELGALALIQAYRESVFGDRDWEFFGVGMGEVAVQLSPKIKLKQMERMNLKDYIKAISSFDVALCLMASPHPSLLPFDMAGSGAIVVTNDFSTKGQIYFSGISANIICKPPSVASLVDGLREAVARSTDYGSRLKNAVDMRYPVDWEETFNSDHTAFVKAAFAQA